jgi:hypothetical protein
MVCTKTEASHWSLLVCMYRACMRCFSLFSYKARSCTSTPSLNGWCIRSVWEIKSMAMHWGLFLIDRMFPPRSFVTLFGFPSSCVEHLVQGNARLRSIRTLRNINVFILLWHHSYKNTRDWTMHLSHVRNFDHDVMYTSCSIFYFFSCHFASKFNACTVQ